MVYASFIYLLAVISPGPNFVLVSRYSSLGNFKHGFAVTLGVCTVSVFFSVISLLGLASVLRAFPYFTNVSVVLGAGYLIFIACVIFKGTLGDERSIEGGVRVPEEASFKFLNSYRVGVLTNLFNMKTIAFMVSIYSGFLAVPRSIFEQISIVVVCSSLELIWYFLVALLFGSSLVRGLFNRYRISIDRGLSLFLVLFAIQNIYYIV